MTLLVQLFAKLEISTNSAECSGGRPVIGGRPGERPERRGAWPQLYCCVAGAGGKGEGAACCWAGGGAGNGPPVSPCGGCAILAAVRVRSDVLRGFGLWIGFGGGATACNTTCTGFGVRLGGGFSQNECSGAGATVT